MANTATSSAGKVQLRYESIRNLTSPEEKENGARSYFANIPIGELMKLDTAANLRTYIPAHPGKKRSQTHKAIADTLKTKTDRFIQLSSGITVSASDVIIDDNKKLITVHHGSIINGAQTQGEIALYLAELEATAEETGEEPEDEYHARVEFLVDPDEEFVVATAIARNTSTNIQRISMLGKKQYFEEMNASFQKAFSDLELSKQETDVGDQFVDTQRLLQVLWAMMPEHLLPKNNKRRSVSDARLKSYKNRAYCLIDFENDVVTKDKPTGTREEETAQAEAQARYDYFVDMAGAGWKEYIKWRHHEGWKGLYLKENTRAIRRTDDGHTVADGVVFPILAAMSYFVTQNKSGKWVLKAPSFFDESEMLLAARDQLSNHKGNPMHMGRDATIYDALASLTKMVVRLTKRVGAVA
jgi:hypothetical protein